MLLDHLGSPILYPYEEQEQQDIRQYLSKTAKVLEIGGRFGVVSCVINSLLENKSHHIVVEPDQTVWAALRQNQESTHSQFHIVEGAISSAPIAWSNPSAHVGERGCGSIFRICNEKNECQSVIPTYTFHEIITKFGFVPDTLVIDCEGAFVEFFRDFPEMLDDTKQIFIEWDALNPQNNTLYRNFILKNGFEEIKGGFHSVYVKNT
jgi:FkbM family methyltransferase